MKLSNGKEIEVTAFNMGHLPKLVKLAKQVGEQIDWSELDDLNPRQAGFKLIELAPNAIAPFMGVATGLDVKEIETLPIHDGLAIANEIMDVNEIDRLVEMLMDFFKRVAAVAKAKGKRGAVTHIPTSGL